jgi:hypothetical protein
MNNTINFTYTEDCIAFNDLANFTSTYDYTLSDITLDNGTDNIIDRPIADIKKEILSATGFLSKVNTESVFAKLKIDIDIPVSELTTFKNIVQYIFDQVGISYDFTNYATTNDFKGITDDFGTLIEFEKVAAMEMILYSLAIDGYVMFLDYQGTVFFESNSKAADITVSGIRDLRYRINKRKTIAGITLYDCDQKTEAAAILSTQGDGSTKIVHRLFGTGSGTYADNFASSIYSAFNTGILQVEFETKNYYPLGGVFNYSNATYGINDDFMVMSKTTLNDSGAWMYRYIAIKKSQCIQMYLQQSIFDKLISRNNFKITDMVNNDDPLSVLRDSISIVSTNTDYNAGQSRVVIVFNKDVRSDMTAEDFKLHWS